MTLPSREETTYSLIVEIARELYDRFVMGGWEPQDAYQQIREWLNEAYDAALSQSTERVAELEKELAESQRMSKVWEDEYHDEVEFNDGDGPEKQTLRTMLETAVKFERARHGMHVWNCICWVCRAASLLSERTK